MTLGRFGCLALLAPLGCGPAVGTDDCDLADTDPGCFDGFVREPFVPEGSTPGAFFVGACVSP